MISLYPSWFPGSFLILALKISGPRKFLGSRTWMQREHILQWCLVIREEAQPSFQPSTGSMKASGGDDLIWRPRNYMTPLISEHQNFVTAPQKQQGPGIPHHLRGAQLPAVVKGEVEAEEPQFYQEQQTQHMFSPNKVQIKSISQQFKVYTIIDQKQLNLVKRCCQILFCQPFQNVELDHLSSSSKVQQRTLAISQPFIHCDRD